MEDKKHILFGNDVEFEKYLGKTSYYLATQNAVSKIVGCLEPNYLLELGCGNGNTSVRLAYENTKSSIVAVDIRENMINLGEERTKTKKIKNVTFVCGDLTKLTNFNMKNVNVVLLLYSFQHIQDPVDQKQEFLKSLYNSMQKGAYVIIGDTFLTDEKSYDSNEIKKLFELRKNEAYYSLFWNNFTSLDKEELEISKNIAQECSDNIENEEVLANLRDSIYLVSKKWLCESATEVGFSVELCLNTSNVNDGIILLKK